MIQIRCIIVDDEYPAREELKYFVNQFSDIKIIAEFDDSIEALQYIEKNKPDVIFLDINMPKLDGMALGKIINAFQDKIHIVFITAYKEHAVDAFEIEAFDYILKPYSEERIINTLRKLEKCEVAKYMNNKITLWKNDKMIVVNLENVCFCKANERHTLIYTEKCQYTINCSISEFYKRLPEKLFFRTHRSFIVNLEKINEIVPWFNNTFIIKLQNINEEIPVSRNNINEFKHIIGV